jgi:hypothetical protein
VVEIGHEHVVLVVDQVYGKVEGNAVLEGVVMYLTGPTIYDIKGNIGAIETGEDSQVGEVNVFEKYFFPVEKRNVRSLISSEG